MNLDIVRGGLLRREIRRPQLQERKVIREDTARTLSVDARALEHALKRSIQGEVRFDRGNRALYSTDASNYRQLPIGVVVPETVEDVIETVKLCRQFGAPVLSRGGGTSLAGQCCNVAVVLDWSKYLNRVLEIDVPHRRARVQPGCVLDSLRHKTWKHNLSFGPDPSTHNRCTLGGMLGNNACGMHAQMAGRTSDNVRSLTVLTYDGLKLKVGATTDEEYEQIVREGGRKAQIYMGLRDLRDRYADAIRKHYPDIPRRISGYNLDDLLPEKGFNVARALVGSEGTLVTILEAELDLIYWPPAKSLVVLGYKDIYSAADHVTDIDRHKPMALEAIDHLLINNIKKKGTNARDLKYLPEGDGFLIVQFGGETKAESDAKARALIADLGRMKSPPKMSLFDSEEEEEKLWQVRESGLGATARVPGEPDTWPGWEDSAVAPERLGGYLRELKALYKKHGLEGALYGHFGQGCVHSRISFDPGSRKGVARFRNFMEEAAELVHRYGGSLSGEHGDGQARAELLPKMFGEECMRAMREFKAIWDPGNKMNPGKVVDPYPLDVNLRLGADFNPKTPDTHFQFPEDHGSFHRATTRCVGVGKCRRDEGGTMCPSYMVTKEEMHSTRGRARMLFEMLRGDELKLWKDDHVHEALDLCLACKGCKGECPVNVDMATYKAEFLSHYYKGKLRPRSAYAMGLIQYWARLAGRVPGLANFATQTKGLDLFAKWAADVHPARKIPEFAKTPFQREVRKRPRPNEGAPRVILFPDTFNNFLHPEVMRAGLEVLETAGFDVLVPQGSMCCGRPLYDYGMLDLAKLQLRRFLKQFQTEIEEGVPFVVLEPSCATTFKDELVGLFPNQQNAQKMGDQVYVLGDFLTEKAPHFALPKIDKQALAHGHCHHKSIFGYEGEEKVLKKMGLDLQVPDSGCCGMAGSFGFEKDHFEISQKVGERVLLPKVRELPREALVIADGFSCQEQVLQGTDRRPLHLAQVIKMGLDAERRQIPAPSGPYPEQQFPYAVKPSQTRVKLTLAGLGIAAGAVLGLSLKAEPRSRRLLGWL